MPDSVYERERAASLRVEALRIALAMFQITSFGEPPSAYAILRTARDFMAFIEGKE